MEISVEVVRRLIKEQFPKLSNLEIKLVEKNGHNNVTFHLGNTKEQLFNIIKALV